MFRYGCVALALASFAASAFAGDADVLKSIAGEWVAVSRVRTGNPNDRPPTPEELARLSLIIKADQWTQTYLSPRNGNDSAAYTIEIDSKARAIKLTHNRENFVKECSYVLDDKHLTVTWPVGEAGDVIVTVWQRKPAKK